MYFSSWLRNYSRDLKLFAVASLSLGIAYSIVDATFNNFLDARFALTGFERSFLEVPRELPGFLVVFVSALLWFLCSRRLGALSLFLGAVGALLIGFGSSTYGIMIVWLFIYSLGQHIFMPVQSTIGMELAREGQTGRRLGQINAIRNLAYILGSFIVYIGFRFLNFTFQHTYTLAAITLGVAALLVFSMKREKTQPATTFLKVHREYRLYYILAILYGTRKQLFITFAPWVLVTIFKQPTQTLATLLTIGGVIGIIFQPLLGRAIDHYGEKIVLAGEAIILIFVCFGYGFAHSFLPENIAFIVVCVCYLVDNFSMSVNMARATYLKKIAVDPAHVQPSLTLGVTIDHVFSISIALLGGVIWNQFGYQYVFLLGTLIAIANLLAALRIRLPHAEVPAVAPSVMND